MGRRVDKEAINKRKDYLGGKMSFLWVKELGKDFIM